MYFYRPATTAAVAVPANPSTSTIAGASQYTTYMTTAVTNKNALVSYDDAATTGALGKQYVILYQKYLAMNVISATEAWCDYRRAAQPKIEISLESVTKQFPKRLLYPLTETNTNQANVPKGVTQYSPIFWDVID